MRVFEVMTEGVQTVLPTMPASDAWELMHRKRIHHLVVTEGTAILGVLSDRDTGSRVGAGTAKGVSRSDSHSSAAKQMERHANRPRLPATPVSTFRRRGQRTTTQ